MIFDCSIKERLCLVSDLDDDTIHNILDIVCILDWSEEIGLNTNLKNNISEGQKLRLCLATLLARAKVMDADILIFDEIDQNLQETLAEKIIHNIVTYFKDKTLLFVLHTENLKNTIKFDKCLCIDNGHIKIK